MPLTTLDGLAFAASLLMGIAMAEALLEKSRKRALSHQQYLDTLRQPSPSMIRHISAVQQHNEAAIDAKYHTSEAQQAATKIQQAYRGHRDRRQRDGMTLDPSARWTEALREVRFRSAAMSSARRRSSLDARPSSPTERARANWRMVGQIAEHAAGDNCGPPRLFDDPTIGHNGTSGHQAADSMFLDLRYFLEMVDTKHRYGANLQVYHEEWQRSITKQNFFEWLDHGEGRRVSLTGCSRARLYRERIRYLSREERADYKVAVDDAGKLRWQKSGDLITTSSDFQDSAHGIVPKGSSGPTYEAQSPDPSSDHDSDTPSSPFPIEATTAHQQITHDNTPEHRLRVSPATILNHLLRASIKPGTWIYVADTVGRLYIGIKSSGAFQHASFLAGARISSAGLIGIQDGQLTYLSPLSGHYRPTIKSFKAFIDSLKQRGVDLSHLRVSRAYEVLLGMEYYCRTKKGFDRLVHRERKGEHSGRRQSELLLADVSAVGEVERHWEDEHPHHGVAKLMDDLHTRRRSSGGNERVDI